MQTKQQGAQGQRQATVCLSRQDLILPTASVEAQLPHILDVGNVYKCSSCKRQSCAHTCTHAGHPWARSIDIMHFTELQRQVQSTISVVLSLKIVLPKLADLTVCARRSHIRAGRLVCSLACSEHS